MTSADGWDQVVTAMLESSCRASSRKDTKQLLNFLANMLEKGILPPSGCRYIAQVIRAVAEEDFNAILPKGKKRQQPQPIHVLVAVIQERERCTTLGMEEVYRKVGLKFGERHGWKSSTVEVRASEGRKIVRETIDRIVSSGKNRSEAIDLMARAFHLTGRQLDSALE